MAQVGTALADGAAGWTESKGTALRTALRDTITRLQRLAHEVGANL
jgi:hypothetical protein